MTILIARRLGMRYLDAMKQQQNTVRLTEFVVFQNGAETGRVWSRDADRALARASSLFPDAIVTVTQAAAPVDSMVTGLHTAEEKETFRHQRNHVMGGAVRTHLGIV
jgi:hypothetical protein